jgi:hypothetical protein
MCEPVTLSKNKNPATKDGPLVAGFIILLGWNDPVNIANLACHLLVSWFERVIPLFDHPLPNIISMVTTHEKRILAEGANIRMAHFHGAPSIFTSCSF